MGLGVVAREAKYVTDRMFARAAKALAQQTSEADLEMGRIYPSLASIREISAAIGAAVADHYKPSLAPACRQRHLVFFVRSVFRCALSRSHQRAGPLVLRNPAAVPSQAVALIL